MPNDKYEGEMIRILGTLMSGNRLTSFINTVANHIYFTYAIEKSKITYNDSVHNGDDMLVSFKRPIDYLKILDK